MKKTLTSLCITLIMMCICGYANAHDDTTHVNIITPGGHNNEFLNNDDPKADTVQVTDFNIEVQEITLSVGESLQLHVNPSSVKVRWVEGSWDLLSNPVLHVDCNGLVTALKAGESYVAAESYADGNVRSNAHVTVLNQGTVKTGNKQFEPTRECDWEDVKFTLTNDGRFIAQGAFYGSGAKTNQLNYKVTDQCIFMWFEIDYADSTKSFYPQPFVLDICDCNAPAYNIYFNNSAQVVESSRSFANYAISRGSAAGGTTNTDNIFFKDDEGLIFDLNGHILQSVPEKGSYIQSGRMYYRY